MSTSVSTPIEPATSQAEAPPGRRPKRFRTKHRLVLSRAFVWCLFLPLLGGETWSQDRPVLHGSLFFAGCLIGGLGAFGRVWSLVYISGRKRIELVMSGPYSLCRNPIYVSSALLAVGLTLCSGSMVLPVLAIAAFAVMYPFVLRKEEHELAALHGESFAHYRATTPAFWPRLSGYREEEFTRICPAAFRRGAWTIALYCFLVGVLELIDELHRDERLPRLYTMY